MVVQWLGLHASTARDLGSIPGRGTKIPQAAWRGQKIGKTVRDIFPLSLSSLLTLLRLFFGKYAITMLILLFLWNNNISVECYWI